MDSRCLLKETQHQEHVHSSKMHSCWTLKSAPGFFDGSGHIAPLSQLPDRSSSVQRVKALVLGSLPEWILPNGHNDSNPRTWHCPLEIKPQYFSLGPSLWPWQWQTWPNSSLSWKIKRLFCVSRYLCGCGPKRRVVVLVTCLFDSMSRVTFSLAATLSS